MVSIISEKPSTEKAVKELLDILENAGCGFHSQLIIKEQGGGLGLMTESPMERDKEIIRLPRTVLMPGDQYTIDVQNKNFVIGYPEGSLATDLQRRVIDKMFEIYNLTDKVRLHEEFSFLLSMKNSLALVEKMAERREFLSGPYKEWMLWLKVGIMEEQYRKLVIGTYVKTRPLGYSDYVRETSVSMIMPVLDFMNHHWEGGVFAVGHYGVRKGDLTMQSSQPFEGSKECYANYGVLDALDSLVRYDFVDETAPVIRSISMEIDGPFGEPINVKSLQSFMYDKTLKDDVQDLRRHIPDIKFKEGEKVSLSHLLIPNGNSKFALVRVLNIILAAYTTNLGKTLNASEANAWRKRVQEQVIEQNVGYYNGLVSYIDNMPAEQQASFGVKRVRSLAEVQLKKLKEYAIQG